LVNDMDMVGFFLLPYFALLVRLPASLQNCPASFLGCWVGWGLPYLWIEGSAFLVIHTNTPQRKVGWGLSLTIEGCLYPGRLTINEERGAEAALEKQFLRSGPPPFFGPPLRIEEAHAIISFLIDTHLSPSNRRVRQLLPVIFKRRTWFSQSTR